MTAADIHFRAAWHGTRIILHQVSPEACFIYDFILELYSACSGDWKTFVEQGDLKEQELEAFLDYAATFLSNIGNYYVSARLQVAAAKIKISHYITGFG
jgi:dipeptidyl-peptidase-3